MAKKRKKGTGAKGGGAASQPVAQPSARPAGDAGRRPAPPARAGAAEGSDRAAALAAFPPGMPAETTLRPLVLDSRWLLQVAGAAAGIALVWALRDLWTTFLFSAVVVFLGARMVAALEARRVPRAAGAALYLAAIGLGLVLLSLLVLPTLVRELIELVQRLPEGLERIEQFVRERTNLQLPGSLAELVRQILTELEQSDGLMQDATSALKTGGMAMGKGALGVWDYLMRAVGAAGRTVLIPVVAFFVLTELPELVRFLVDLAPASWRTRGGPLALKVGKALQALVRGQLTVALMMAVLYAIGLSISGVPLALAISILAGLAYLIPFASPTVCVGLSVIFTLLEVEGGLLRPLLGCVITAVVVQLAEGWVLTPRVVGDSAGLSPLAVVLAVLIAGSLFGFLGVLFALPVAAALGVVLRERALAAEAGA